MTTACGKPGYLELAAVWPLKRYRVRRVAGLALSAFGTIVWGWGKYLGWASFTYLMVWAVFAARDARRDFNETGLHGW